jgi:hypothetical protein
MVCSRQPYADDALSSPVFRPRFRGHLHDEAVEIAHGIGGSPFAGAVSEVCADHFGGQPSLFSDSVQQLKKQLDVANTILECCTLLADMLKFTELTERSIRETLEADITTQHFAWLHPGPS